MNYIERYKKNEISSMNAVQAFIVILDKTHLKIAQAAICCEKFDTMHRVKSCADAALNIALIVEGLEQGAIIAEKKDIDRIKTYCLLLVENIYRANIKEDTNAFKKIADDIQLFKNFWHSYTH
jgi:flagellin-specific chaperone FliS